MDNLLGNQNEILRKMYQCSQKHGHKMWSQWVVSNLSAAAPARAENSAPQSDVRHGSTRLVQYGGQWTRASFSFHSIEHNQMKPRTLRDLDCPPFPCPRRRWSSHSTCSANSTVTVQLVVQTGPQIVDGGYGRRRRWRMGRLDLLAWLLHEPRGSHLVHA